MARAGLSRSSVYPEKLHLLEVDKVYEIRAKRALGDTRLLSDRGTLQTGGREFFLKVSYAFQR